MNTHKYDFLTSAGNTISRISHMTGAVEGALGVGAVRVCVTVVRKILVPI